MKSLALVTTARKPRLEAGPHGARGFTLIELMIVVVLLAVLISLAAPSMRDLVRDQRIKTATFDVYSSLVYARSEAIKRNGSVSVIPNAGGWANGWSVQTGGTVLRRQDALPEININKASDDSTFTDTIAFQGNGRLAAAASEMVLKFSASTAITARCIRVNLSGLPNIKVDTNRNPVDGCQ
ncbi:MAG: GspH/FimT family pseudopilin [Betaproteobacteria bacterium]|nr:GspH/FimT family pseudopilin [Betaproteobacteria bacterium]